MLKLNRHSITKLIISLTLTRFQCYFFNTLSVDYIYTGSVDLTLGGFTVCKMTTVISQKMYITELYWRI